MAALFYFQPVNQVINQLKNMKKNVLLALCMMALQVLHAQVKNPVQWSFTTKKINAKTVELHLTATIEKGWHIYSQTTPEGGPVPTTVTLVTNPVLQLTGKIKELGKLEQHHEKLFGVDVKQFSGKVTFVLTVTKKAAVKTTIAGTVEFMACNDHECLPPKKQDFSVKLP